MRFARGAASRRRRRTPPSRRHTSVVNRLDVVITQRRSDGGSWLSKMERDERDFMEGAAMPCIREPHRRAVFICVSSI